MNVIESIVIQDYLTIVGFAVFLNALLIGGSVAFYLVWHAMKGNQTGVNTVEPLMLSDYWAVLSTLICNVLVFIFGAFLWKEGYLAVDFNEISVVKIVLQLLVLLVVIDFWMYVFHKLAHSKWLYPLIHQRHHEHVGVNALSLFVLSPFEALGFGVMLLAVLYVYPFHYVAVGMYLVVNVVWGTIGHFNKVARLGNTGWVSWLGTASFHNRHHLEPQTNFGFYTTLWDRLFQTSSIKPFQSRLPDSHLNTKSNYTK